MNYQDILVSNEEGIVTLTLNRPDQLNAVNSSIMHSLYSFFTEDYKSIEGFKGVIITGSGEKAFAAGADIKEFLAVADDSIPFVKKGHNTYFAIENFHKPVIAVIKGYALGGGLELALACHMRLVNPKTKISFPEVNLGLIPGYGGTQRMSQLIGKARAMELMMTTDMIDANQAVQYGVCNRVVEDDEIMPTAKKMIAKIASKGPVAVKHIIKTINAAFDESKNGFDIELQAFADLMQTKDFEEGVKAFMEKRKAHFIGE